MDETAADGPAGAGQAARDQAAREAVSAAFMIAAIPVMIALQRKLSGPDAMREIRMRAAYALRRFGHVGGELAHLAGDVLNTAAVRAKIAYERETY